MWRRAVRKCATIKRRRRSALAHDRPAGKGRLIACKCAIRDRWRATVVVVDCASQISHVRQEGAVADRRRRVGAIFDATAAHVRSVGKSDLKTVHHGGRVEVEARVFDDVQRVVGHARRADFTAQNSHIRSPIAVAEDRIAGIREATEDFHAIFHVKRNAAVGAVRGFVGACGHPYLGDAGAGTVEGALQVRVGIGP